MPCEDETYRSSIGGHTRTCTCIECSGKRQRRTRPAKAAGIEMTAADWQSFTSSIGTVGQEDEKRQNARASADQAQRDEAEKYRRFRDEEKRRLRPPPASTSGLSSSDITHEQSELP